MVDLRKRMLMYKEGSGIGVSGSHNVIVNPLALESYLYCLKRYILVLLIQDIKETELETVKGIFQQLQNLAENKNDRNKYYFGKSAGLLELVENLFMTTVESNKSVEIQDQIMINRTKLINY